MASSVPYTLLKWIVAPLVLVICVIWLVAEPVAKSVLESELGKANGAEANIEDLHLTLFPVGFELQDLQLTDPARPKQNRISARSIAGDVELGKLLRGNVHIRELVAQDLAMNTVRESAGNVFVAPDEQAQSGFLGLGLENITLPEVDEILANNQLQTTKAAADLESAYKEHRSALESSFNNLPNKDKLEAYKQEIKTLKQTEFSNPSAILQAKEKVTALKQQLRQDKQQFAAFKQQLAIAKDDLQSKVVTLKAAPEADYQQLSGLLTGDADTFANAIGLLFGPQAEQWSKQLYGPAQTLLALMNGAGTESEDATDTSDDIADLLIHKARISFLVGGEKVDSEWENITHQHQFNGNLPTTFTVKSPPGKLWNALTMDGDFRLFENKPQGSQRWDLNGIKLDSLPLFEDAKLTASLTEALLNTVGELQFNGETLDGTASMLFGQLDIAAEGSNNLTNALASILTNADSMTLVADIRGTLSSPGINLSSDLDELASQALKEALSTRVEGKKAELLDKLQLRATDQLALSETQVADLLQWEGQSGSRAAAVDDLLENALESLLKPDSRNLLDALKSKLKF